MKVTVILYIYLSELTFYIRLFCQKIRAFIWLSVLLCLLWNVLRFSSNGFYTLLIMKLAFFFPLTIQAGQYMLTYFIL